MEARQELVRALAVGKVGPSSARLWLRSPGGGAHVLELWPEEHPAQVVSARFELPPREETDWTYALDLPGDAEVRLAPCTRYRIRVSRADGESVGEAGFDTAPENPAQTPSRFSIALSSCHQPFEEDGSIRPHALAMLKAGRAALAQSGARFLIQCGDQFYADYPENQSIFRKESLRRLGCAKDSLFDCPREEVRRLYQARYRWFWGMPEYLALQSQVATYPILDDHEVIDNWHSEDEHLQPRFTPIREGARAAYEDYQHSRLVSRRPFDDASYHYSFDWGALGVFVMDVRSQRQPESDGKPGQVCGESQMQDLARWLEARRDFPMVIVVVSVPPLFMPEWMAWLAGRVIPKFDGDAHDRWAHPQFVDERSQLLSILHRHQRRAPRQRLLICSGDVHVGYALSCVWRGEPELVTYQFVSSALTHEMAPSDRAFGRWVPRAQLHVSPQKGERARLHLIGHGRHRRFHQPVAQLNLGLIEIALEGGRARMNLKLIGSDEDSPGAPVSLLESGMI